MDRGEGIFLMDYFVAALKLLSQGLNYIRLEFMKLCLQTL
jgi:hypothetical protein